MKAQQLKMYIDIFRRMTDQTHLSDLEIVCQVGTVTADTFEAAILAHFRNNVRGEVEGRTLAFMRENPDRKIAAIKLYRELSGSGLKDAKDKVEALARFI